MKKTIIFYKKIKYTFMYLSIYRKKYRKGIQNPLFNDFSANILSFKQNNSDTIEFFLQKLITEIPSNCTLIPYVPKYESRTNFIALSNLVIGLCLNDKTRTDGSSYISRKWYIDDISNFAKEPKDTSNLSINVKEIQDVSGKNIILITDVLNTNHNSFEAYIDVLRSYSPKKITLIALAKYIDT